MLSSGGVFFRVGLVGREDHVPGKLLYMQDHGQYADMLLEKWRARINVWSVIQTSTGSKSGFMNRHAQHLCGVLKSNFWLQMAFFLLLVMTAVPLLTPREWSSSVQTMLKIAPSLYAQGEDTQSIASLFSRFASKRLLCIQCLCHGFCGDAAKISSFLLEQELKRLLLVLEAKHVIFAYYLCEISIAIYSSSIDGDHSKFNQIYWICLGPVCAKHRTQTQIGFLAALQGSGGHAWRSNSTPIVWQHLGHTISGFWRKQVYRVLVS